VEVNVEVEEMEVTTLYFKGFLQYLPWEYIYVPPLPILPKKNEDHDGGRIQG